MTFAFNQILYNIYYITMYYNFYRQQMGMIPTPQCLMRYRWKNVLSMPQTVIIKKKMSKSWKFTSQELELTVLSRFACDLVAHGSIAQKDGLSSPLLMIDLVFKTENISVSWWGKWRVPLLWRWQHRVSLKDAANNETMMTCYTEIVEIIED